MVYHHRKIDRKLFEKYRRRFQPLLQRGQPVSVGSGRRRDPGDAGLPAEGNEGRKAMTFTRAEYAFSDGRDPAGRGRDRADRRCGSTVQKYFARGLPKERTEQEYTRPLSGQTLAGCLLHRAESRTLCRRLNPIGSAVSAGGMGTAFADPIRADHDLWCTGAGSWLSGRSLPICPPRRWAARSGAIKSPSSSPATGSSAPSGRLTGYAGGVDRKAGLLELEHSGLCIPRRGAGPGEKS